MWTISRGDKSGDPFGNRTTIRLLPARIRVTLLTELSGLLYEYLIISLWISVSRKMVFLPSEKLATYLDELRSVQVWKLTTHCSILGSSWLIEHCYSDVYLLASLGSFKSTNKFYSREETGDLPSLVYPLILRPNELLLRMRFTDEGAFIPRSLSSSFYLSPSVWLSFT